MLIYPGENMADIITFCEDVNGLRIWAAAVLHLIPGPVEAAFRHSALGPGMVAVQQVLEREVGAVRPGLAPDVASGRRPGAELEHHPAVDHVVGAEHYRDSEPGVPAAHRLDVDLEHPLAVGPEAAAEHCWGSDPGVVAVRHTARTRDCAAADDSHPAQMQVAVCQSSAVSADTTDWCDSADPNSWQY